MSDDDRCELLEAIEMADDRADDMRARVDAAIRFLRGRQVPGATGAEQELIREVLAVLEAP